MWQTSQAWQRTLRVMMSAKVSLVTLVKKILLRQLLNCSKAGVEWEALCYLIWSDLFQQFLNSFARVPNADLPKYSQLLYMCFNKYIYNIYYIYNIKYDIRINITWGPLARRPRCQTTSCLSACPCIFAAKVTQQHKGSFWRDSAIPATHTQTYCAEIQKIYIIYIYIFFTYTHIDILSKPLFDIGVLVSVSAAQREIYCKLVNYFMIFGCHFWT